MPCSISARALLAFACASLSSVIGGGAVGFAAVGATACCGELACGSPHAQGWTAHTKPKISKNSFIALEGVDECNQNCSVSGGLSACGSNTPLSLRMQKCPGKPYGHDF